jgi:amidohydrolase
VNIKAIREQIHSNPELGNQEFETSELIQSALSAIDIPHVSMAGTGVVGLIDNGKPATLLLRADMDALPIQETTGLPFASKNNGVMHACGHDMHIAMLLGAAERLMQNRDKLNCNIKLVFQPDEEGDGGARRMIEQGVLENPHVDAAIAFHVWPEFEYGTVGTKIGEMTATCDEFEIVIKGKGGHVAKPQFTNNPITPAFELGYRLKHLTVDFPHILDVTNINSGSGSPNVVPDIMTLSGSMRVAEPKLRTFIPELIKELCEEIEAKYDVSYVFTPKFQLQYPPMVNDEQLTGYAEKVIKNHATTRRLERPYFIAEDFACFSEKAPSTLILLGCCPPDRLGQNDLHQSDMMVDERTLQLGVDLFTDIAMNYCIDKIMQRQVCFR